MREPACLVLYPRSSRESPGPLARSPLGRRAHLGLGVLSFHGPGAQRHRHDPAEGLLRPALAPGHRQRCTWEDVGVFPQLLFGRDCLFSEPARRGPSPGVARRGSAALLGGLLGSGQEPRGRGRPFLVSPFGPAVLEPDLSRRRGQLRQDPSPAVLPQVDLEMWGPASVWANEGYGVRTAERLRATVSVAGQKPLSHSGQPSLPNPLPPSPPPRGAPGAPSAALCSSEPPKFWNRKARLLYNTGK